jgi:nucleotide-binding universal stress UspA family protein
MQPFKHLLVAVDSDGSSDRAVAIAVDLAGRYDAALTLLHAYELPAYVYPGPAPLSVDLLALLRDAAQSYLDAKLADVKHAIPSAAAVLRAGNPAQEILASVLETHADLVVIGTHGRRGVARGILGSVAEKVVRLCPVPVLTVRPG